MALRRAIHATGSFRVTAFRPEDLSRLRTLQALCARLDLDPLSPISPPIPYAVVPSADTSNLAKDNTSKIRHD